MLPNIIYEVQLPGQTRTRPMVGTGEDIRDYLSSQGVNAAVAIGAAGSIVFDLSIMRETTFAYEGIWIAARLPRP
ncbi:hypothetical protein [Ensifer sp. ENS08]|uniref:hypothetical protein n=1 Tax=Ensifer sp. ENS08 TaxID=2769273 RepID=UPI001786BBCB|nr:hypothetical protein [Ensifer sp. ENS08]MBD9569010.1 hypothetical protein [Ensifer sp. ENS08]